MNWLAKDEVVTKPIIGKSEGMVVKIHSAELANISFSLKELAI